MKAMVLAAGEGTRLHPLTYTFPKPLVPIVNIPVMEHILLWLASFGIRDIVVNTHYKASQIENYFQNGKRLGMHIIYSREDRLWGTAGGVKRASTHLRETFLVIGSDDLTDVNLSLLLDSHRKSGALATIGVKEVENTEHYGIVLTQENGKIISFQEKPKPSEALSRWANTGIYIFEPEIFSFIPEGEVFDFGRQLFPFLLKEKLPFFAFPVKGYWIDVGTLNEYQEAHWAILEKKCKAKIPGKEITPGIWVEEDVAIHPKAILQPPCIFGKGTVVEKNAFLNGFVVAGKNCWIKENTQLHKVILWENAIVEKESILHHCVLTSKTPSFETKAKYT
jgi:NDP-sugar pyrophosphorylase family protein